MDLLFSIISSISLRVVLGYLDDGGLGQVGPAVLGLWEGALIHHLSNSNKSSSSDHYLAYALGIAVDFILTGNAKSTFVVFLWSIVGLVIAEATNPLHRNNAKHGRRKVSRFVPSHARVYHPPAPSELALGNAPPLISPKAITPLLDPNRPRSPPSFFLEGESETSSNSPKYITRYLPSALGDVGSDSPISVSALPTPPATLVTDGLDPPQGEARHPLSPIEEISSSEETSNYNHLTPVDSQIAFAKQLASYTPSVAVTTPLLTIPNSSMRILLTRTSNPTLVDNSDAEDMYVPPVAMTSTLPISNRGDQLISSNHRPATPSEPDELRTPNLVNLGFTDHDELRTPNEPLRELSPLFSSHNETLPDVVAIKKMEPKTTSIIGQPNVANLAVEYSSSPPLANGSEPEPDTDQPVEAESSVQTETDTTSVISFLNSAQLYSKAELLRKQARQKEADRLQLKQELSLAESQARIKDVLFLREDIRTSEIEAKKLHEKAVRRFFKARNSSRKPQTIDVHGLRVAEAIQITERALRQAFTSNYPFLKVIVGKGLHSQGGRPVLKEVLIKTMEGLRIPCKVDPNNPGVLILSLR